VITVTGVIMIHWPLPRADTCDAGKVVTVCAGLREGVGLSWEAPWICHGNDEKLVEGMFVAIEGFLGTQNIGGAMFEENGYIGPNGYENLSTSRRRYQS
jgi:hypothetical protein